MKGLVSALKKDGDTGTRLRYRLSHGLVVSRANFDNTDKSTITRLGTEAENDCFFHVIFISSSCRFHMLCAKHG